MNHQTNCFAEGRNVIFKNYGKFEPRGMAFTGNMAPFRANWHESILEIPEENQESLQEKYKESLREIEVMKKIMNTTEQNLLGKLAALEAKLTAARGNVEELKKVNNFFRTIGFSDNPDTVYDSSIDVYLASHQTSWNDWSIETRIRALNITQKMSEFFVTSLQKSHSKKEVETRVIEMRRDAINAALYNPASRSKEWLAFDKLIAQICKSSRCTKEIAMNSLKAMGMKSPEGYVL